MVNADHRRVKVEEKRERREIKGEKIEREKKRKNKRYYGILLFPTIQRSCFTKRITKTNSVSSIKLLLEPKSKKLLQR